MEAKTQRSDDSEQHDGFNVVDTMSPQKWVDFGYDGHSEYIHLIPDKEKRELRCYRSVGEDTEENQRIKTTIEDVHFKYWWDDEPDEINGFYLTWTEADSFMSFVQLMELTRRGTMNLQWSEADGGTMMDDEKTSIEALTLSFRKENGVKQRIQIRSEWQTRAVHPMAKIEGAKL